MRSKLKLGNIALLLASSALALLLCGSSRRTGRVGDDSLDLRGLHDCGVSGGLVVSRSLRAVLFYVMFKG
ncbi:MAG: hypothetical protein DMG62_25035 [Acidobacteria bacterium]|nr:MAG: hypothetical protein DMG62_25035 [Acidobacteriota bacterium]